MLTLYVNWDILYIVYNINVFYILFFFGGDVMLQIFLSLLLTIVVYLIYPLCFINIKGKVDEQRGKKIALWNSIVCAGLCVFIGALIGAEPETSGAMFAPAILYYYINKAILIAKEDENVCDDEEDSEE